MRIKLSQSQWRKIGQKVGWMPRDPGEFSDSDLGPIFTADEEETALLGPEEDADPYHDGMVEGTSDRKSGRHDHSANPYRIDTDEGVRKFDEWKRGYEDGWNSEGFEEAYR